MGSATIRPMPDYNGKKITIIGLGSLGGGSGAAAYLSSAGAVITVTDLQKEKDLQASMDALSDFPGITYHLGGHQQEDFESCDLVVVNPAVREDNPFLLHARTNGIKCKTELNLLLERNRHKQWIGITGSNGKSTTTRLIYQGLTALGHKTFVGGNLGGSLLNLSDEALSESILVLEVSSFQAPWIAAHSQWPDAAVLTNLTPNHLDRHGTMEEYACAKQKLLRNPRCDAAAVLNRDDPRVTALEKNLSCSTVFFSVEQPVSPGVFVDNGHLFYSPQSGERTDIGCTDNFRLPGIHNQSNACAALAAIFSIDSHSVSRCSKAVNAMAAFEGIEHRLELSGECHGMRFINDSVATTPESTIAGLRAFPGDPILLIAGGYDKKIPLDDLASEIIHSARAVFLIGDTGGKIKALIEQKNLDFPATYCGTLATAMEQACSTGTSGDVVLFSPACASYDQFRNFEHRGQCFKKMVLSMGQPAVRHFPDISTPPPDSA